VGLKTCPVKKKIVEKPPRNSAGFCGGGQGQVLWSQRKKERISFCILCDLPVICAASCVENVSINVACGFRYGLGISGSYALDSDEAK
jgi:hypothetical protein